MGRGRIRGGDFFFVTVLEKKILRETAQKFWEHFHFNFYSGFLDIFSLREKTEF